MNALDYPPIVLELIARLKMLPSIGSRGAERMALWLLQGHQHEAVALAKMIQLSIDETRICPDCGFFCVGERCEACEDMGRDRHVFCVVEQATDILPIERSGIYHGLYHCLGGKLSPLDDVEPEDLNIGGLLTRIDATPGCEVILATGSDVEGETTALYLTSILKERDCRISRLAQGLPAGAGLGHADALTLMKALQGRTQC
ncbi:MAG: recombination mediator RecR [Akkermansia sp.]